MGNWCGKRNTTALTQDTNIQQGLPAPTRPHYDSSGRALDSSGRRRPRTFGSNDLGDQWQGGVDQELIDVEEIVACLDQEIL